MSLLLGVAGASIQAGELYPWQLTRDSLLLFEGSTYRYTVDTPENEGLSSTLPSVEALKEQLAHSGSGVYRLFTSAGQEKTEGFPAHGDYLQSTSKKRLLVGVHKGALPPVIKLDRTAFTIKTAGSLTLDFYAGQRSPMTTVTIRVPEGVDVTLDNTTVNVIGRGEVILRDLPKQSIGRTGTNYSYKKVGDVEICKDGKKGTLLIFKDLDFRPSNGPDIRLCFRGVVIPEKGNYAFEADYITSQPEVLHSPVATATFEGVTTVSDFTRTPLQAFTYKKNWDLSFTSFYWTAPRNAESVTLLLSEDKGRTWKPVRTTILPDDDFAAAGRLNPNQLYAFKLLVKGGDNQGESNIAWFYSGLQDIKTAGVKGDGIADDTETINQAIKEMNELGGGILRFTAGTYNVRLILPGMDKENVAVFNLSDIQILRNDATVQAVYSEGNTTCWVAAYQPVQLIVSTDLILNIQTPGIYMIRKNESGRYIINYADPTQQRNVAELELNHKKVRISLPEGKEKGKTTSIVG